MGFLHLVSKSLLLIIQIGMVWQLLLVNSAIAFDRKSLHDSALISLDRFITTAHESERQPEALAVAALPTDVKISETYSPAMFNQDHASLIALKNGEWLSVWQDERLGREKVFTQRLDSLGSAVGSNLMIAGNAVVDMVEPKVFQDTSGRIYLYYRDRIRGMIFGSRFTSGLAEDLQPFLANDTSSGAFGGPFDFAVYPDGRTTVVWENYSTIGSTIGLRIYDASGNSVAGPITVNSDGGSNPHWVPKVAVQPGSGLLVVWEDYRNGQPDVLGRLYRGDGVPLGNEFSVVPPGASSADQYTPQVVWSDSDKYVIGWIDCRIGQEVYVQRYNPVTGAVGINTLASSGDTSFVNWDLSLAESPQGRTLAVWGTYGPSNSILSRSFSYGMSPIGQLQVKNMSSVGRRWSPAAQFRSASKYGLAWTEFASNDADINFMTFDTAGNRLLTTERQLNDDIIGAPATRPSVVNSSEFLELFAFASRRQDDGDIYVSCASHAGLKQSASQRVNQDTGFNLQAEPHATKSPDGCLVVWLDGRAVSGTAGQRIFGRVGSKYGLFSTPEFIISDSTQAAVKSSPKAIMTAAGRGLVVWLDKRSGSSQVYGRWLNTSGQLDGSEFLISSPASDLINSSLQVGVDSLDRFYVVWLDAGITPATVKGKWYNTNKSLGGTFSYNSTPVGVTMSEFSLGVNDSGFISLLWTGTDAATRKLYLTVISRTSAIVRTANEITDNANAYPSDPCLSVDENSYHCATWIDNRVGVNRVYYQILTDQFVPIGGNQSISSECCPEFMEHPVTYASHGRAWFAWADPRQDGLNIYGNLVVYLPTDAPDDNHSVPTSFSLGQNYPNPFNPSTEIRFTLPSRSRATLAVFNLLGEEVRVLSDATLAAGEHRVIWDGADSRGNHVASGIYFYRLTSGSSSQTKKMVLLK